MMRVSEQKQRRHACSFTNGEVGRLCCRCHQPLPLSLPSPAPRSSDCALQYPGLPARGLPSSLWHHQTSVQYNQQGLRGPPPFSITPQLQWHCRQECHPSQQHNYSSRCSPAESEGHLHPWGCGLCSDLQLQLLQGLVHSVAAGRREQQLHLLLLRCCLLQQQQQHRGQQHRPLCPRRPELQQCSGVLLCGLPALCSGHAVHHCGLCCGSHMLPAEVLLPTDCGLWPPCQDLLLDAESPGTAAVMAAVQRACSSDNRCGEIRWLPMRGLGEEQLLQPCCQSHCCCCWSDTVPLAGYAAGSPGQGEGEGQAGGREQGCRRRESCCWKEERGG